MAAQILALADILGHHRVFVSIYENGSSDKTKEILEQLAKTLDIIGIDNKITLDKNPRQEKMHRIEYMAHIRNRALEPLYKSQKKFSKVVFLNDVFFCFLDILELLYQAQLNNAHLTCAEDYEIRHGALSFYDTWVSRDILGNAFKSRYQNIADDGVALLSHLNNRPFQVQCCWNGLAVIDASVFAKPHKIRFRRSKPSECSASECSLLCNDMWSAGFQRAVVVPRVKVSYDMTTRDYLRAPDQFPHDSLFADKKNSLGIVFRPGPDSVYCHPLNSPSARIPDGPATFVSLKSQAAKNSQ
ncbi:hypothetical protein J3B02_003070 [Coemansia erecta]|uniref:Uncharacterized protein n=1 Tax=Coemansia asiatica TaxID=1052880 RepID=A0A9W7XNQ7_9FUNG|nr:hypothetical protein LPJ64_002110 [Coemansia asiatica]KAJ2853601.1 hypothetical protein J3B02_003070 [Coemansia erecta]KAJ2888632.1 hypothetical protein FB639_000505 [Coemansia asiatica]